MVAKRRVLASASLQPCCCTQLSQPQGYTSNYYQSNNTVCKIVFIRIIKEILTVSVLHELIPEVITCQKYPLGLILNGHEAMGTGI
jgi:hypothetical protein